MKEIEYSQRGIVKLIGESASEFPMWSITKYLDDICNHYNKILQIVRTCIYLQNGDDSDLWVAKKSVSLFPDKSFEECFTFNEENYVKLAIKAGDPEQFWHIVTKYVRPVVFVKKYDNFIPLVDLINDDAIKIRSLSYNSPPLFDIEGVLGTLIELAYAGKKDAREEEEHIARQLGQSADNYRRIAHASQIINDERTPEGVKVYANKALSEIIAKQEVLNRRLNIRVANIDRKV
ncbi:hypothetical protein [Clostridium thermosuccinogenes]|uniref:hypothetical protein n=1 Tax=Clostridium thermosuccinogenes TaxID=84032 RepID=UPI000CCC1289|nr:hypothetical protein [Pseudoclostridium thermosuccinogenes]PNT92164.1 hypothetical protein CDQ83_00860 [Pseudoclostridium thermosuccinogenes]